MSDTKPLTERLEIKAMMIQMGERIAYGSDSGIMHEAVAALKNLQAERDALMDRVEKAEKDAARLDYMQQGVTVELLYYGPNRNFRIGGRFLAIDSDIRTAIDAAMEASK